MLMKTIFEFRERFNLFVRIMCFLGTLAIMWDNKFLKEQNFYPELEFEHYLIA